MDRPEGGYPPPGGIRPDRFSKGTKSFCDRSWPHPTRLSSLKADPNRNNDMLITKEMREKRELGERYWNHGPFDWAQDKFCGLHRWGIGFGRQREIYCEAKRVVGMQWLKSI
jgi:hypothetical protein